MNYEFSTSRRAILKAAGVSIALPALESIGAVKAAKYSNTSLMPQVFDGLLKPEEIADLIAYLAQAK